MASLKTIEAIHYETGRPVRIEIRDTLIHKISETSGSRQNQNLFVAPGLIDNQVNGYMGVDFSDTGLTTDKMVKAIEAIRYDGVTSILPTIITNSHGNLLRNFRNLAVSLKDKEVSDSVPGFHLEGPYISHEEGYFGCHPSAYIRKPSWDEFAQYQEAADGNIIQVTVGPETEGCIDFIKRCTISDIKVAIGHTNASADQIYNAVEKGARLSTHLGNGCANLIDRHRNPLWPQLANDLLTPTIIADGHHLLPEEIRVFYKVKGPRDIILTSDVNHLIGMAPGKYLYFGSEVIYSVDGLVKNPVLNVLAGASMPLKTGVGNIMKYTGCTLGEAINMASGNAARIYNLTDRGSLEPGKRADLILLGIDNYKIEIKQVWVKGKPVR